MPEPPQIRVLIADDHFVVRQGIKFSLLAYPDIEVVGEATNGDEALRGAQQLHPDVVLMDVMMAGTNGIVATRAIRELEEQPRVLVLTSFQEGELVREALQAGAIGYLLKDIEIDELVKAIRMAARGVATLAPVAAQALVHSTTAGRPPGSDLTEREREVLDLLALGLTNNQIAQRLYISVATVKFHIHGISTKLGASSRTEAVALAYQHGLIRQQRP